MAGFKLIETYLSSESEDDDDDDNQTQSTTIQSGSLISNDNQCNAHDRKQLLPLPQCFASWMNKQHEDEIASMPDDNEVDKHEGRTRSFKHERGNWASLVYIEHSPSEVLTKWMSSIIEILPIKGDLIIGESHISLTRTLILKFHWIESFADSLKRICRSVDKFTLDMINVKLYCNEERTRTFIGIECQSLAHSFEYFMELLNKLLAEYELPPFYEDASYHISFFWTLGDKELELQPFIPLLNDSLHNALTKDGENNLILVSALHCKIGNKIYIFPLK